MLSRFVGKSRNIRIKKEIWVGFWVVDAILASRQKILSRFVHKPCNTHIKKKKIDSFVGSWCNTQIQYEKYVFI
jgi:hypothetical protein